MFMTGLADSPRAKKRRLHIMSKDYQHRMQDLGSDSALLCSLGTVFDLQEKA